MRAPLACARLHALACAASVAFATSSAVADDVQAHSDAEALFRDGLRLLQDGHTAEACSKLAESQRLGPAAGTLLNLGGCYEKLGKTASAWISFTEAIPAAQARKRADWEALARRKAAELEPKLPRLRIVIPQGSDLPDLAIKRDDVDVGRAELGTAIPVDPGAHVVSASAPGHASWERSVEAASGRTTDVSVPVLLLAPAPPPPERSATTPAPDHHRETRSDPRKLGGTIAAGVGAAGVVFGIIAGMVAINAKSGCTPYPNCASTAGGPEANDRAHLWAGVSTVSVVAGAALLAGGLILVLTAPGRGGSAGSGP